MLFRAQRRKLILPIITIGVILSVCFITIIAKAGVNDIIYSREKNLRNLSLLKDKGLNDNEILVLAEFSDDSVIISAAKSDKPTVYSELYQCLRKHFSSAEVNLGIEQAESMVKKIISLNRIIAIEDNKDIKDMTLDAKGMSITLAQQIYQLCGLKLSFNLMGDIVSISNADGTYFYQNLDRLQKAGFNIGALIITILIILVLLAISTIVTVKSEGYRGYRSFDKGRFA